MGPPMEPPVGPWTYDDLVDVARQSFRSSRVLPAEERTSDTSWKLMINALVFVMSVWSASRKLRGLVATPEGLAIVPNMEAMEGCTR